MQKIAILAILGATLIVAGIFAVMPVEKATTMHQTLRVEEQAKTEFYQFVDTPYEVTYSDTGVAQVNFMLAGASSSLVPVDGYREVCVRIAGTADTTSFTLNMGKISGSTVSELIAENQPIDSKIHCYNISGPEVGLWLRGTPSTTDQVQLWMYLRS